VQQAAKDVYEIIVTDDSVDALSKDLLNDRYSFARWVQGPKRGPAANRNNGAKYATGEWLVFIDDDCVPDNRLVAAYCNAIENNPQVLAFEGAILPNDWALLKKDMAECPVNTEGGCFWSANICVQKKLFHELGGFNEQFLIAAQEDQELYARIKKYTQVVFCTAGKVIHPVRYRSLQEKIQHIPAEIKNWILFLRPQHSWWRIFMDGAASQIRACFKTLRQNKLKQSLYHFFSLAYLIPGIFLSALQNNGKQKI
jgi:GT2 family glycosyltransferase